MNDQNGYLENITQSSKNSTTRARSVLGIDDTHRQRTTDSTRFRFYILILRFRFKFNDVYSTLLLYKSNKNTSGIVFRVGRAVATFSL